MSGKRQVKCFRGKLFANFRFGTIPVFCGLWVAPFLGFSAYAIIGNFFVLTFLASGSTGSNTLTRINSTMGRSAGNVRGNFTMPGEWSPFVPHIGQHHLRCSSSSNGRLIWGHHFSSFADSALLYISSTGHCCMTTVCGMHFRLLIMYSWLSCMSRSPQSVWCVNQSSWTTERVVLTVAVASQFFVIFSACNEQQHCALGTLVVSVGRL